MMPKKLLILSQLINNTGNKTTATRLKHILDEDFHITLLNIEDVSFEWLKNNQNQFDCCIAIHALLGGVFASSLNIPYILIMAGTDIYQEVHPIHQKQKEVSLEKASFIVTYNKAHYDTCQKLWPNHKNKISFIEKSLVLPKIRHSHEGMESTTKIKILLPASIRKIKDQLFALKAFNSINEKDKKLIQISFIGPILEQDYFSVFKKELDKVDCASYMSPISRDEVLGMISDSDIVLNTSIGEGVSNVLMESLYLGKPILARKNDGNNYLGQNEKNFFQFSTENELKNLIEGYIVNSKPLLEKARIGRDFARKTFSVEKERERYIKLIKQLPQGLE